jgi:hypothetical protein
LHEIETDRIVIRKFTPEDWKDLYDYLSDATVVKFEPYDTFTEVQCKLGLNILVRPLPSIMRLSPFNHTTST